MTDLALHRLQFSFTITYHYLFPQLTMGLALLIVVLKTLALRRDDARLHAAARFWTRIFGVAFAMGVVTGVPMEFQFGTNWARFSEAAGGVIGQTLAMEGVFAFFLESAFLGLFLYGEGRLSPRAHWLSAVCVFLGSWLSGFFIVATGAFMQHPVGHSVAADGTVHLESFWALLSNPWLHVMYAHTMLGAVTTGAFALAGVGAYYVLSGAHVPYGRLFVRTGVVAGLASTLLLAFPTGDLHAKQVAEDHPASFAAMEGLFESEAGAGLVLVGQPDMAKRRLDNPIEVPRVLSFLTWKSWDAEVRGLEEFPEEDWPDNIPLLYYAYHIMVGLGTLMVALMGLAALLLWRRRLFEVRPVLWALMLATPFPFVANTAGWLTTELGRQPWLIWGLLRTEDGTSAAVASGNVLFTLLGFMGMYALLSMLFLLLLRREIAHGPDGGPGHGPVTPTGQEG